MKPQIVGPRFLIKTITLEEFDPAVAAAKKMGIIIADKTERQEATIISSGMVIQVGTDIANGAENIQVGDKVEYVRHGGMFVQNPDNKEEKWLVINDEDIVVVWRDE